jgi:putative ABC transport system substrate-binding protein
MLDLRRRQFLTLLAGAAAWPLAARAQQTGTNPKLGVLHPGQAAAVNSRITAIREGLNDPARSPWRRVGSELRPMSSASCSR